MGIINKGFSLIEVLLAGAILTILLFGVSIMVNNGLRTLGQAKNKSMATSLAQNVLEMVRNLSYEDVGTIGGIPSGPLDPENTINIDGINYLVRTSVLYIDDPFDGLVPSDFIPTDYKRIKVSVSWDGFFASKEPVVLMTDVSPKGIETAQNQGTISVLVFNALGQPISGAKVHIQADVSPPINLEVFTDEFGTVLIPGAPVCTGCYRIEVSKPGFTSDRTYGFDEVDNPMNPHLSVLNGQISKTSFAIDRTATLNIKVTRGQTSGYAPFTGVQFIVRGTKEIGRTADDEPIYKINRTIISGSGGLASLTDLEWDNYFILLPDNSTVDYAGSWPFNPVSVSPGETINATMVVAADSPNSLLLQLLDELQQPVTNVRAELKSGTNISTASAGVWPNGDQSQIFFSNLSLGSYSLTISGPGYATISGSLQVIGNMLEKFTLATASGN